MEIGDKVQIIHSPYSSVKNGEFATIINIKFWQYGESWKIYILDTKPCSSFRKHELKKIEEKTMTWDEGVEIILKERDEVWRELAKL